MNLFVFGLGYSATHFVLGSARGAHQVSGTVRSLERVEALRQRGIEAFRFDGGPLDPEVARALGRCDGVLISAQPGPDGDPVLAAVPDLARAAPNLRVIVYLSTIGVYGDHGGAWIDETAAVHPDNSRQDARLAAEDAWITLGRETTIQVVVLRLAGIYGPGRNALLDLRAGEARRIIKPGQVFNRIHVTDIGGAIAASLSYGGQQAIFNVTDDEPAPAADVVAYAAALMGVPTPPDLPFEQARLSPMALSFYSANRRVRNLALRKELGLTLRYPTYRAGLDALWASGEGQA